MPNLRSVGIRKQVETTPNLGSAEMGIREHEQQRRPPMESTESGTLVQGWRSSLSAGGMGWMMVTGAVHDAQAFLERYKRNISETFLVYLSSQGYI